MGLVVIAKKYRNICVEFLLDKLWDPQLLLQPNLHGLPEQSYSQWSRTEVGFDKSIECQNWFIIEANKLDLPGFNSGIVQTIFNCLRRKCRIVFYS